MNIPDLLWKLKKSEGMLSDTEIIEKPESIRVIPAKSGNQEVELVFETMDVGQLRLFTMLHLDCVLEGVSL